MNKYKASIDNQIMEGYEETSLEECLEFKRIHENGHPDSFVVIELVNKPTAVDFIDPT